MLEFCPTCSYYMYLSAQPADKTSNIHKKCKNCGYVEMLKPTASAASGAPQPILETNFRSGSSAGGAASGITINSNTMRDPTLPHVKTIICPNAQCPSQTDESKRDVIYIETDPANLKFEYVCTVCTTQWTN